MPAVAPVPFAPFWGHDDDADPLAGGALYAFAAGTDTPLATYANPQGTTVNPHPVLLDDAGYAHVYLHAGVPYKLRLDNSQGVQMWEIDQVYGSGAGGSSHLAGVGWGQTTVEIRPLPGQAQTHATVFPPDVLALGLTVWVKEPFGTSQGLEQIGVGRPEQPDCWGLLQPFAGAMTSTAGDFLVYSGQPQPTSGIVSLTAYGGRFDGAGSLYVTGHFCTFTPGQVIGQILARATPAAVHTGTAQVAVATPTVSGSRQGNAGLASLLRALESLELITDATTP